MIINLPDNWTIIKHTTIFPEYPKDWWELEHAHYKYMENIGYTGITSMQWVEGGTGCSQCGESTPKEIEGFIKLLEWER